MCDFYSEIGRQLGQFPETYHDATNSHSAMIEKVKWRDNQPQGRTLVFEFECKLDVLKSDCDLTEKAPSLVRNFDECPKALVRRFVADAENVRRAIKTGRGLSPDGCFSDTKKFSDVWSVALSEGAPAIFPEVFRGYLAVYGSAKLDALVKVGGYLEVYGSATLDAPALKTVNGKNVEKYDK